MKVDLRLGDCLDVMAGMEANSVDSVITDPPYGLKFLGQDWDHGIPGEAFWRAALCVAKPGAILLAFGGTRTHHRLWCAIEGAGWELRDTIMWVYGSGLPKSHNIGEAIEKAAGAEREVIRPCSYELRNSGGYSGGPNTTKPRSESCAITAPATPAAQLWDGWGTALKPALEPICVAMKPLNGTFALNALAWGVAGLNIDGSRVTTDGRWPANLIRDSSDEVMARFPNDTARFFYCAKASRRERNAGCEGLEEREAHWRSNGLVKDRTWIDRKDGKGPVPVNARLQPRANHHPAIKPLALMEYLCNLTRTPTGGVVLDPFMGSGTTGVACVQTGRNFIGIEIDADYMAIAMARIAHAQLEPAQQSMEFVK